MKIDILTLFPAMFDGFKSESIIKKAIKDKKVEINTIDFREFSKDKHKKVDDTPYGGGQGMVLMCQPVFDALDSIRKENSKVILLSPQGKTYNQKKAYELAKEEHLILICGHYEGFDERIKSICDEEISVGDYVLSGGEIPSMVITDSIVRLLPGVIDEASHLNDSFNNNLLDYPTYTKPRNYKGMKVPDVLLSGDHAKIDKWRYDKQLKITMEKRPDLLNGKISLKKDGLKKSKNKINIDDIKDIKVTEIKPKKKSYNKYKIEKTDKTIAITILNPNKITGYKLKGKNNNKGLAKILIVKTNFISNIAYKNVLKKIDVLAHRLNDALNDDDEDSTSRVLDEAQMLRQMIISMYANYLGMQKLDKIMENINRLVNEFIKNKTINGSFIQKEIKSGIKI